MSLLGLNDSGRHFPRLARRGTLGLPELTHLVLAEDAVVGFEKEVQLAVAVDAHAAGRAHGVSLRPGFKNSPEPALARSWAAVDTL